MLLTLAVYFCRWYNACVDFAFSAAFIMTICTARGRSVFPGSQNDQQDITRFLGQPGKITMQRHLQKCKTMPEQSFLFMKKIMILKIV